MCLVKRKTMSLSRMRILLPKTQNPFFNFSIYRSSFSSSSSTNKPLHLLFQQAVDYDPLRLINEIKVKLSDPEKQVRDLKKSDSSICDKVKKNQNVEVRVSNSGAEKLRVKSKRAKKPKIYKELSDDMRIFLTHLHKEGYFRDANFSKGDKLDFDCFNNYYGRNFITFAAENFGHDKQDIAEGLSGSDLKNVALFGCPSIGRKNVYSSKRLRLFFGIKEDTVCNKCVLKDSCPLVNQNVEKDSKSKTLNLADITRVITIYALEASDPKVSVPEEIKASVSRLLNEILKLSQTTS